MAAVVVLTAEARGQWPSSPAQNLAIADRTGDQVQPKIRVTSDGGCYISWFDNATGGYDVYLQRLDPRGYEQWAHNGILIANRSYSWTTDYDLAVDADDNAILTYNDDRSGSDQIGCNKISPAGTLLWGPTGVWLTSTTEFVASPKVAVTSTGDCMIGWTQGSAFCLQKVNASGVPQWTPVKRFAPTSGSYLLSDLEPSSGGAAIASWVYNTGGYSDPRYLYSQKYSASGTAMWGFVPVVVFNGGSLQMGTFPPLVPDGSGGAVYAWYDVSGTRNCYVQHVSSLGVEMFSHNGLAVSTLTGRIRLSPAFTYSQASGEIFVFWTEANTLQTQWGLYGQRISAAGSRLWTSSGLQILPLSTMQNGFLETMICGSGAILFYVDNSGAANLKATRFDALGNPVWSGSPRMVCSVLSSKWGLDLAHTPSGMAVLAWADQRVDSGNIYAQNVKPDGDLGLPAFIFGDMNCDGWVNMADIPHFVQALLDPAGYEADHDGDPYPLCYRVHADTNQDTLENGRDIQRFVELLVTP
ncbi:MAG TPA: hypothetical protein VMV94_03690 [Phycisphaerae bacterium]|nr:hypothetical protein [Phycisphaerae bacterium]